MRRLARQQSLFVMFICLILIIAACTPKETDTETTEEQNETEQPSEQDGNEQQTVEEQTEEQNEEESQAEDEELSAEMQSPTYDLLETAPKVPTNLEEFLNYPSGPLAGRNYTDNEGLFLDTVKEALPPLGEDTDQETIEAYWRALSYLMAEDYPHPDEVLTQMSLDSFGLPEMDDDRYQFKEQLNVLVVLDVSGSMANEIDGKPMMDIAKDAIRDFTAELPEEANVGLRVYGHEGDNTNAGREESCASTELVYDLQPIDQQAFNDVLAQFEPTGWTPIARTLEEAKEDFASFPGEENTNLVYLVSDGIETCDGDPVAAAEALTESDIQPIINVIGFNVDANGQQHLREVAEAGGGLYANAGNEEQLREELDRAEEILNRWEEWKRGAQRDASSHRTRQKATITGKVTGDLAEASMRERYNTRYVLIQLGNDDYIPREIRDYLLEKNSEKMSLYIELHGQLKDEMHDQVDEYYRETLREIEDEFEEEVGE